MSNIWKFRCLKVTSINICESFDKYFKLNFDVKTIYCSFLFFLGIYKLDKKINTIIRLHLLKSLTKIQEILHSNNIYLNDDKLYRIITKFRNINFPKDEEYLSYKNNLTIT